MFKPVHEGVIAPRVRDAKWLLSGHNRHKIHTYHQPRPFSEEFGSLAARATRQAKWQLGYAKDNATGVFGDDLYNYLLKRKARTPIMLVRARLRKEKAREGWVHPLKGLGHFIGFPGQGTHSWYSPPNNWQSDRAWDIETHVYTPVVAVHAGVIDHRIGPLPNSGSRFAGNRLYVNTPDGNSVYYAHLEKVVVRPGQQVEKGQLLGYSGSANGVPHLHIAFMRGNPCKFPW